MSALRKPKPRFPLEPGVRLFGELGEMFAKPDKALSPKVVSISIDKSLRQLKKDASYEELVLLRDVARELAFQVDRLLPADDNRTPSAMENSAELERAQREDALGKAVLHAARSENAAAMATPESIRMGNELIARVENDRAATGAGRIANKEFLGSAELQQALGVKRQALSGAVKSERLFAIVGPSGENHYPAYYADPTLDRRTLEQVSKVLGSLPAASKHHFFTSVSTQLQETPLDALRKGRKSEVLAAAAGFAQR
jgi:hypothetical protein